MHRLHNPDAGKLFIRIALALVFIHAGWLKLHNMEMVLEGFSSMGIPAFLAYFVTYVEFIGGILMLAGFLVRYVGILLAIIMAVATFKAHWANGFGLQNNGYEYVSVLFFIALSATVLGAGDYTLRKLIKR